MVKKYTFEEYLSFIEDKMDIKLFDWQKEVLRMIHEGKTYCCISGMPRCGLTVFKDTTKLLKELMEEEN